MSNDNAQNKAAFIAANATVIGDVSLAEDTGIWYGAVLRADRGRIVIGKGSNVQDNAVIHESEGKPAILGEYVTIGHGAVIHGCTIGDRVLVGMGAVILNGAKIGEDSIVAAGAVVTENKEFPPKSLIMGVPGKAVRELTPEQVQSIMTNADIYINLAKEHASGKYAQIH